MLTAPCKHRSGRAETLVFCHCPARRPLLPLPLWPPADQGVAGSSWTVKHDRGRRSRERQGSRVGAAGTEWRRAAGQAAQSLLAGGNLVRVRLQGLDKPAGQGVPGSIGRWAGGRQPAWRRGCRAALDCP